MPPIPIAVHSIQDRSAVVARRSWEVGWSFGSEVVIVPHSSRVLVQTLGARARGWFGSAGGWRPARRGGRHAVEESERGQRAAVARRRRPDPSTRALSGRPGAGMLSLSVGLVGSTMLLMFLLWVVPAPCRLLTQAPGPPRRGPWVGCCG